MQQSEIPSGNDLIQSIPGIGTKITATILAKIGEIDRFDHAKVYYDNKRAEGKLFKVAVIACANKLLHWIFAILTKKEAFILD